MEVKIKQGNEMLDATIEMVDGVEKQHSKDRCTTCALSEMCFMLDCFPSFCDTFIKKGWHFKKSDKKFEV